MKNLLAVFFFLSVNTLPAQDYVLLHTIPFAFGNFTTDPLGNCYIFSKGDISKFNTDGIETARYSSREFGDITYVDATNSLKVLVVFKDFSKAVVLDASLAPQATIDLSFPDIPFVNVICTSRESGFWIVDPVAKQIRKINDQLTIVQEGTPFRQISVNEMEANYMTDSGDWLIVNATGYGLLVFDRFGTYFKTIPDIYDVLFQASGNDLLFKASNGMMKQDIRTGKTDHFLLPENNLTDLCRVEGNRIFLKSQNTLKIYSY